MSSVASSFTKIDQTLRTNLQHLSPQVQMMLPLFTIGVAGQEIVYRCILLVGRVFSMLRAIPKGEVLQEARYFTAELIETICVIALSILRIPLICSNAMPSLLRAQAWIERKIEYLSGEHVLTRFIAKIQQQKNQLLEVHSSDKSFPKSSDVWLSQAVTFDNEPAISYSKVRRIARGTNWERWVFTGVKEIQPCLSQHIEKFIAIVGPGAIQTYIKSRLVYLNKLQELLPIPASTPPQISSLVEEQLTYLQEVKSKISQIVPTLQRRYDPNGKWKSQINSIEMLLGIAFQNLYFHISIHLRLVTISGLHAHFSSVVELLAQINRIYSLESWAMQETPGLEPSFTKLDQLIDTWYQLFREKRDSWNRMKSSSPKGPSSRSSSFPTEMDRSSALHILGLAEGATQKEITQAYRKKALVHHPDRGGTKEGFQVIQNAYHLLIEA